MSIGETTDDVDFTRWARAGRRNLLAEVSAQGVEHFDAGHASAGAPRAVHAPGRETSTVPVRRSPLNRFENPKARNRRRAYPIMAYVGPNGSGKSASAVYDSMPTLAAGRQVLSTVRLLDWENGGLTDHPAYIPFTDWQQLLDAEHCDVIMDEVTGIASSRESHSMPAVVANVLVQLRRRDVVLRWTAPNWARADKIIRECTQGVTHCRGFFPTTVRTDSDDESRLWRQRRMFRWYTYAAESFDEFTEGKREGLRPEVKSWHWGPGSAVFSAYNTYDAVLSIGTVSDSGRCHRCSGKRAIPSCSCDDYVPPPRARRTRSDSATG